MAATAYSGTAISKLSHFVQAYRHLPGYLPPILVGMGSGAALANGVLAQAPTGTFGGALGFAYAPGRPLAKPLCAGPSPVPAAPWFSVTDATWSTAFDRLVAATGPARPAPPPAALRELPIVEVPAAAGAAATDRMAILLSGDGGWAGLDKDVAGALAAQGIPVVGLDSLRYFWTPRSPDAVAADLGRMIGYYTAAWHRPRVLLIGYSQGADVLPFAVNRLAPAARASVALTAVLGLSAHALFEFHVSSWIGDDNSGPATLPEMNRISGMPVACIYGADDDESLCPSLDGHRFTLVRMKGGHHFDGDYAGLARQILAAADRSGGA